jgi:phosphonate transport system permease protein
MSRILLQTEGFVFNYGKSSHFSLSCPALKLTAGLAIALVGPSGGGKSTLLKIFGGLLDLPDSQELLRTSKVAFIHQELHLVIEKTCLENILMGALGRIPAHSLHFSPQILQEAKSLAEDFGLNSVIDQPVSTLSGGQKQRVAIARALMAKPEVLLADEPFSSLDHSTTTEIMDYICKIQKKYGFCLLLSTHNLAVVNKYFNETWSIHDGRVFLGQQGLTEQKQKPLSILKHSGPWETALFVGVFIFAVLCINFLSLEGFNSENAGNEVLSFFQKLFIHSPASLQQVSWWFLLERLLLTLQMAFLGTFFGFLIALPLSFLAAYSFFPKFISVPFRFLLVMLRSIPSLVWAMLFVAGLGLGTVAGIAALSVYTVGYLSKWIYEGFEDMEQKPFSSLRQFGASRWQALYFSVLPMTRPLMISAFVFMLEYNVRSASLLGLVGAGGIGQDLVQSLEWRDFPSVFAILVLILSVVLIFDFASSLIRKRFVDLRN